MKELAHIGIFSKKISVGDLTSHFIVTRNGRFIFIDLLLIESITKQELHSLIMIWSNILIPFFKLLINIVLYLLQLNIKYSNDEYINNIYGSHCT